MGQTIAEKILSRHNLEGTPVKAGEYERWGKVVKTAGTRAD